MAKTHRGELSPRPVRIDAGKRGGCSLISACQVIRVLPANIRHRYARLGLKIRTIELEGGLRNQMDSRKSHILIVDDSEDEQDLYASYLTRQGFRVSKAHDGEEGLDKALALEPDLIVLDLWLPKISGWGVMMRLKSDERTKHIPVLVVTGDATVQRGECEVLLTKPCPPDELGAEIARRVRGHASRRLSGPPVS